MYVFLEWLILCNDFQFCSLLENIIIYFFYKVEENEIVCMYSVSLSTHLLIDILNSFIFWVLICLALLHWLISSLHCWWIPEMVYIFPSSKYWWGCPRHFETLPFKEIYCWFECSHSNHHRLIQNLMGFTSLLIDAYSIDLLIMYVMSIHFLI